MKRYATMFYGVHQDGNATWSSQIQWDANINLPGKSFDDWLTSLTSRKRSNVKREMRVFKEQEWDITVEPVQDIALEGVYLVGQHLAKHGININDNLIASYLKTIQPSKSHDILTLVARKGGVIGGFVVGYVYNNRLWMRLAGFDYSLIEGSFAYFNLVFYEAFRHAYHRQLDSVHLGMESSHAKKLRGATLTPLYLHMYGWSCGNLTPIW